MKKCVAVLGVASVGVGAIALTTCRGDPPVPQAQSTQLLQCQAGAIDSPTHYGGSLQQDSVFLYWWDYGGVPPNFDPSLASIRRMAKAGGAEQILAQPAHVDPLVQSFSVNSSRVVWIDDSPSRNLNAGLPAPRVMRVPKAGGNAEEMAVLDPSLIIYGSAADEDYFYFTANRSKNYTSLIMKVSIDTGAMEVLADNLYAVWGVALDDQYVYWSNYGSSLPAWRIPKGGGTPEPLGASQDVVGAGPIRVANGYVYLGDEDNGLARVPTGGGYIQILGNLHGGAWRVWSLDVHGGYEIGRAHV